MQPLPSRLPFELIRDPSAMRARCDKLRRNGARISLVPTMGSLHEGHLSLLRAARARADVSIITIFVNPTQFGDGEDLDAYPRNEPGDLKKARSCGVDIAFCPDAQVMYPAGFQTYVEVHELQKPLCGASRRGHFRGVATVVCKLFHIVNPHVAVFGQKDYQQLALIRRMVEDLAFSIDIVGMPVVREPDGLAMSSRNAYLSPAQREQALSLWRGLQAARRAFDDGQRDPASLCDLARRPIDACALVRIDYVELCDAASLATLTQAIDAPAVLAVAVFVGDTRLIDNALLAPL